MGPMFSISVCVCGGGGGGCVLVGQDSCNLKGVPQTSQFSSSPYGSPNQAFNWVQVGLYSRYFQEAGGRRRPRTLCHVEVRRTLVCLPRSDANLAGPLPHYELLDLKGTLIYPFKGLGFRGLGFRV